MPDIRYGSDDEPQWLAMVTQSCALVVDRSIDDDRAEELWSSVRDSGKAQGVLDTLTKGGISFTPAFAFAEFPTDFGKEAVALRVIVRGNSSVTVTTADMPVVVTGTGVTAWVEREVDGATSIEIGTLGGSPRAERGRGFALNEGVAAVDWLLAGSLETAPEVSAVQPIATPDPQVPSPVEVVAPQLAIDPEATISDQTLGSLPLDQAGEARAESPTDGDGYDFLFGETVARTVEGAAVRSEPDVAPSAGDHDGRTAMGLSAEERRAARQARRGNAPAPVAAPGFFINFTTGEIERLDSSLIIGRAPSAAQVSSNSVPRLVTVGGPDQDISRSHLQVSVEGGTVLLTDLHSRNGTMITLPGRPPQQLRAGQPIAVITGTIVDLGSGITFSVGEE